MCSPQSLPLADCQPAASLARHSPRSVSLHTQTLKNFDAHRFFSCDTFAFQCLAMSCNALRYSAKTSASLNSHQIVLIKSRNPLETSNGEQYQVQVAWTGLKNGVSPRTHKRCPNLIRIRVSVCNGTRKDQRHPLDCLRSPRIFRLFSIQRFFFDFFSDVLLLEQVHRLEEKLLILDLFL